MRRSKPHRDLGTVLSRAGGHPRTKALRRKEKLVWLEGLEVRGKHRWALESRAEREDFCGTVYSLY
jgi:hypothetical protein